MGVIFTSLIVGGVAGWLAGLIMKGQGQGVLMNIVFGIIGGVLGGWLFSLLDVQVGPGMLGSIVTATIGAVLLLFIIGKLKN